MVYINKNKALNQLEDLMKMQLNKKLAYMPKSFNVEQQISIDRLKKRIFLEKVVEESTSFNKKINWDHSMENLKLVSSVENLVEVFKLRSDIYTSINYQSEFPDIIEGLNFDKYDEKSAIIYYQNGSKITGTTRLIFDSKYKLPSEEKYSFDEIRKKYKTIGELSRLIVKHESKGLSLEFKYLMKGAYLLFMNNDIDITLLGIKKQHYKMYTKFGGNNILAELDNYGKLDLKALILSWNPAEVSDFFKKAFLK
ncbi:MAG: N-acyl amino acid synthase FeeM domain-containing protein [Halarcobacter sp.]